MRQLGPLRRIRRMMLCAGLLLIGSTAPAQLRTCVGDCSGGNVVTVDEILRATTIALGNAAIGTCPEADRDGDQNVTVDEILIAIENALEGCAGTPGVAPVVNRHSGLCLEVADGSLLAGANVQQGICDESSSQSWSFQAIDDDHLIVNRHSSMCLEVAGASRLDKATLRQGNCTGDAHQRWQILRSDEWFLISSTLSARCADVGGSSVDDGADVIQFECRATNNQLWVITPEAFRP